MINKELAYIIILPITAFLWMAGGTWHKSYRRFGIPLLFLVMMLLYHITWWQACLTTLLTCGAYHLGYGVNHPWREKAFTALAYSVSTFPLGFTPWQIVVPLLFLLTFILSLNKHTKSMFPWKICEGLTGFTIGITVAHL